MKDKKDEELSSRKIIIVLVEGKSDKIALNLIEKFCISKKIKLFITDGDITSDFIVTHTNCGKVLDKKIKKFRNEYKLEKSDIFKVIHLVDTDGAFIPDKCIESDENCNDFFYTTNSIKYKKRKNIIDRNSHKASIIKELLSKSKIEKEIDYELFYMSCNLDHVLYNEINMAGEKKVPKAFEFRKKYKDDKIGFFQFFNSPEIKVNGSYNETWNFIQKDVNSLNRYSNLWIFLNTITE